MLKNLLRIALGLGYGLLIGVAHAETATGSDNPLEICEQAPVIYYWHDDLEFDCSTNYTHIFSRKDAVMPMANAGQVRIGSFNLFHMGDGQAPLKRTELVARIINQWDIVATQELMPVAARWTALNQALFQFLQSPDYDPATSPKNWRAFEPGYLQVLDELRALDSSWSLIMQPAGRDEVAGFFYRSSRVRLKSWNYCRPNGTQRNVACTLRVPDSQRRLMSRNAFAAYFQSGSFDFIGVTTHVRFRPVDSDAELQAQTKELCAQYDGSAPCHLTKEKISRFYEVKAIGDQIPLLTKTDPDVLFMGDFNLEITRKNEDYWRAALKAADGFTVYQDGKTSLSVPYQDLASNYDHFVLNRDSSRACDVDGIAPYDFTQAGSSPGSDPILREIDGLQGNSAWQRLVDGERERARAFVKVGVEGGRRVLQPLADDEIDQMVNVCEGSVERMKVNSFGAYMELISDHIPIRLNCRTN